MEYSNTVVNIHFEYSYQRKHQAKVTLSIPMISDKKEETKAMHDK